MSERERALTTARNIMAPLCHTTIGRTEECSSICVRCGLEKDMARAILQSAGGEHGPTEPPGPHETDYRHVPKERIVTSERERALETARQPQDNIAKAEALAKYDTDRFWWRRRIKELDRQLAERTADLRACAEALDTLCLVLNLQYATKRRCGQSLLVSYTSACAAMARPGVRAALEGK